MFALAGKELGLKHYIELGANVTESCWEMYRKQSTGLGPEAASVPDLHPIEGHWIMRPEVVESIFILYRVTGDVRYRQWGWHIAQSIWRHARTESGLTGLPNVNPEDLSSVDHNDRQESYFMAETIKYLYLLFCDPAYISIDEYVFNTEAHPFPIIKGGL